MQSLSKQLRIKANMIEMGEKIAWGSDCALMREAADTLDRKNSLSSSDLGGEADIFEAYQTWPDDIKAKLSAHDLRRMNGWAPRTKVGDWRIDTSAGGPILVYKDCSVIEGEDARYVLSLIQKGSANT